MNTICAVVPLRSLRDGKHRLSAYLEAHQRMALVQDLFIRTYRALLESAVVDAIWVVSPDPAIVDWVGQFQVEALWQPGHGLNPGLQYARDMLLQRRRCTGLLVILPDLPLVAAADIAALVRASAERTVVLAPDRHARGTNALLLRPPDALPFCFGEDSLRLHTQAARTQGLACRLYRAAGTAIDLDTPSDLEYAEKIEGVKHQWAARVSKCSAG